MLKLIAQTTPGIVSGVSIFYCVGCLYHSVSPVCYWSFLIWYDMHISVHKYYLYTAGILICGRHTVKLSIFLNCGQWWWASLWGGAPLREQFWDLRLLVLSLQSRFHWGQPFIPGLSQKPLRRRKRKMEKEGDQGWERVQREGKCFCSLKRSSLMLWISMLLMKSADVERMYRTKCVRRSEQQHEQELLVELCYCVCSLCNLSATLLRPLLYSNIHIINIIIEA